LLDEPGNRRQVSLIRSANHNDQGRRLGKVLGQLEDGIVGNRRAAAKEHAQQYEPCLHFLSP
jgi:hypothetical protein